MWRIKYLGFFCVGLAALSTAFQGCHLSQSLRISSIEQMVAPVELEPSKPHYCTDEASYQPDLDHLDHTPIKYLRVNIHFMNSRDSSQNYNGQEAKRFGKQLIAEASKALVDNRKMWLPVGNETLVLPVRYRYELTTSRGYEEAEGIYCHYDDDLYWFVSRGKARNNYDRDVINEFGIGLDSIINLFVMPHHPDSVLSETYKVTSAGIALGSGVKISGVFETKKQPWEFKGIINHEIGHVLGLRHTWNSNDGCDDTPRNMNCWNNTQPPPCDTAASNNLMDYNAGQNAWTPCQIGKIHMAMSREKGKVRKLLIANWCRRDPSKTIEIKNLVHWYGAKDLEGDLIVREGGELHLHCRLSIPEKGEIVVERGAKLILHEARIHNACGAPWNGILVDQDSRDPGIVSYQGASTLENVVTDNSPSLIEN